MKQFYLNTQMTTYMALGDFDIAIKQLHTSYVHSVSASHVAIYITPGAASLSKELIHTFPDVNGDTQRYWFLS